MNKPILCTGELRYTIYGVIRAPEGQLYSRFVLLSGCPARRPFVLSVVSAIHEKHNSEGTEQLQKGNTYNRVIYAAQTVGHVMIVIPLWLSTNLRQ